MLISILLLPVLSPSLSLEELGLDPELELELGSEVLRGAPGGLATGAPDGGAASETGSLKLTRRRLASDPPSCSLFWGAGTCDCTRAFFAPGYPLSFSPSRGLASSAAVRALGLEAALLLEAAEGS